MLISQHEDKSFKILIDFAMHDFLKGIGIESIGRFGKWDYLWTFQAFESGMKVAR